MLPEVKRCKATVLKIKKEYIEDYLQSKPEIKIVDFYVDDGYSGVNFDRPDFQRMLQDIKTRR